MVRKEASEYPEQIEAIFRTHRHSRREFVLRAGKLALGSVVAGALFDTLAARRASAQQEVATFKPRTVQRVVVIGAGHYHATAAPGYLKILQNLHLDIVGVHDFDPALAKSRAEMVGAPAFTDYKAMCETTKPDFVLSLCRHDMMPGPIRYLINAGYPFMAEKPWGIDARTVNGLAELAEKKKSWATFPASMRYSMWAQTCREMVQKNQLGPISHMIVRFNQPGTQRYLDEGSPWMLSKKTAGGGCLLNLGIHGFDLCHYITGEEPKVVSAVTSHRVCDLSIEDYAFVTLRTPSGMIFINEAGYTYPTMRGGDSQQLLSAKNFVVGLPGAVGAVFGGRGLGGPPAQPGAAGATAGSRGAEGQGMRRGGGTMGETAQVVGPGRNETIHAPEGFAGGWPGCVADAIDRCRKGLPPAATAQDNARAVTLTFDSYRMAGEA